MLFRFLQVTFEACRHKSTFSLKPFWQNSRHCSTPATLLAKLSRENIPWPVFPAKRNNELTFSISSRLNLKISAASTLSKALQTQTQQSTQVERRSQCHSVSVAIDRKSDHYLLSNALAKTCFSLPLWRTRGILSPGLDFLLVLRPAKPFLAHPHSALESQWWCPFHLG